MADPRLRVQQPVPFESALRTQAQLLRRGESAVHLAVLDGPVVSVGVGVPEEAPYLVQARAQGIPTVRRSSGGTGVLHLAGDLVWARVLPRTDRRVGRDYVRGFARLGSPLVTALQELGVEGRWVPAPGLSETYCPLGSRGEVLEVAGRGVAAAAQHLTGTALLHHGTLAWHVDRARIAELFAFPEPSMTDRLAGLDEVEIRGGRTAVVDALARHLESSREDGAGAR